MSTSTTVNIALPGDEAQRGRCVGGHQRCDQFREFGGRVLTVAVERDDHFSTLEFYVKIISSEYFNVQTYFATKFHNYAINVFM